MYVLSEQGLQLLDWSCLSIPRCADNIVAKVLGADLSLLLYERYVDVCLYQNVVPLPRARIQGDIQPLLSHLRFQTRFCRPDLVAVIHRFDRSGVVLLPISLQIILRGKALPSFFIALSFRPHQKEYSNMRATRYMNSY